MDPTIASNADYVIVGAGSAGCVLAARLSEDPKVRVVLLEAGPRDLNPWLHVPIGYSKTIGHPRYDWSFQAGPEPGLDGRMLHYARGKTLGGSSSINGLAWTLGSRHDYTRWQAAGCSDWGYEDVIPYLRGLEDFPEGGPERGRGGPVRVRRNPGWQECIGKLQASCTAFGIPAIEDANVAEPIGVSQMQTNVGSGRRISSARAFLRPARGRANLQVLTGVDVKQLEVQNGAASGVTVQMDGKPRTISAAREIILCAGAVGSPLLLERSGIGDPERLAASGIATKAAAQEVGENAADHYMVTMKLRLRGLASLNGSDGGMRALRSGLQYALLRNGPLSRTPTELVGFARLDGKLQGEPDIELFSQALTYAYKQVGGRLKAVMDREPGMSFSFYQCYPRSRGHVHLSGQGKPSIVGNYLVDQYDQEVFVGALRMLRKIAALSPLADHVVAELAPGPGVGDGFTELLDFGKQAGSTTFHLAGTCRMGSDERSVVDQRLRVRAVRRLRVVDASVFPTIIGTHTNAPVMMIAERAAEFIRKGE